ncbi:hypothetical protein [Dysgonomonas sp.]
MRRIIFFSLYFLCPVMVALQAQVTIGSGNEPNPGAILDLKEEQKADNTANSKRGLGLPRVELNSLTINQGGDLKTTINVTHGDAWDKEELVGLIIYNLADDNDNICPGLYVWDGERWQRLGKMCIRSQTDNK